RHWAKLQALWLTRRDGVPTTATTEVPADADAEQVAVTITPSAAGKPGVLPRCPGPFGGTTVLVVPNDTPPEEVQRWLAIEDDDPLAAESRFHRVRVGTAAAERSVPSVLAKLRDENRTNVLIVPAEFYADPVWLRS